MKKVPLTSEELQQFYDISVLDLKACPIKTGAYWDYIGENGMLPALSLRLLEHGYIVVGIDTTRFSHNPRPDYLYTRKGVMMINRLKKIMEI